MILSESTDFQEDLMLLTGVNQDLFSLNAVQTFFNNGIELETHANTSSQYLKEYIKLNYEVSAIESIN